MKRFLLLVLLLGPGIYAQGFIYGKPVRTVSALPGSCTDNVSPPVAFQGKIYQCSSGSYGLLSGGGGGAVSSVFGRTGGVVSASGDYTFAQIGSKPTTLAGYGITDAVASFNGRAGVVAPQANDYTFAQIGSKPTTLSGYGITDAAALSHTHTATQISDSTSVGRALLLASDAAAQRNALGLGAADGPTFGGLTLNGALTGAHGVASPSGTRSFFFQTNASGTGSSHMVVNDTWLNSTTSFGIPLAINFESAMRLGANGGGGTPGTIGQAVNFYVVNQAFNGVTLTESIGIYIPVLEGVNKYGIFDTTGSRWRNDSGTLSVGDAGATVAQGQFRSTIATRPALSAQAAAGAADTQPNLVGKNAAGTDVFKVMTNGVVEYVSFAFASLPTGISNGSMVYCSNCTIASPCASGGSGAFAKRINGAWVCD